MIYEDYLEVMSFCVISSVLVFFWLICYSWTSFDLTDSIFLFILERVLIILLYVYSSSGDIGYSAATYGSFWGY